MLSILSITAGLTLAFTTALYNFCSQYAIPFFPMYTWVGLWTSAFLMILSAANACTLIKYCTRFTDEVFNALLAVNFIYEAMRKIVSNFFHPGLDKTQPLLSLNMAVATFFISRRLTAVRYSKYFTQQIREFLSDFGPSLTIIIMSLVGSLPSMTQLGMEYLKAPLQFQLAGQRPWLIPFMDLPVWARYGTSCTSPWTRK